MKKKNRLKKIISAFLAAAILVQSLCFDTEIARADSTATEIDLSTVSSDVHLFTNLQFKAGSDDVETGTGSYLLSGTASGYSVYAGNETYAGTAYQSRQDIEITSANTEIDSLILNPVGANSANYIRIDVTDASAFTNIVIAENALVEITADDALSIGTVTMGAGSSLSVLANGSSITIGRISAADGTAAGEVTLSGSTVDDVDGSFTVGNITAENVSVSDCLLYGASGESYITASESFAIDDAQVSTFNLIGYPEEATGAKTLIVTGSSSFKNVENIGALETCTANITLDGTFTLEDSYAVQDFNLTYYSDTEELSPESSWPVSYRVRFSNGLGAANATTIGYHESSGAYAADAVELPKYSASGYGYAGWIPEGDTAAVTYLPDGISGDQKMSVKLEAGSVTISYDLMFDPDETSCDDWKNTERTTSEEAQLGDSITLKEPQRFGYRFAGWKAVTGSVHKTYSGSYNVALSNADNSGGYIINFEAQWEAVEFPFKVFIAGIDTSTVGVIVAGTKYDSIAAFADSNSHVQWVEKDAMLQFDTNIKYGESLEDFFKRLDIDGTIEPYDKTEGASKQDFQGWVTQLGDEGKLDCTYEIGSLVPKPNGTTLSAYQSQLMNTPVFIQATWDTASYTVTTTVDSSWEFLVNGVVQNLTADKNGNATVPVEYGAELTWRYNISKNANFSGWRFTSTSSAFVTPSETTYSSSNVYISFKTTMPSGNVVAVYNDLSKTPIYVDASKSDITLEDSVKSPSGRTVNGFWYDIDMNRQDESELTHTDSDGVTIKVNLMSPLFYDSTKGYFYEYHTSDKLYITSREIETTNQLTIVSARSTYFRDCNMVARSEYSTNFVYRKAYGTLLEYVSSGPGNCDTGKSLAGKAWGECGNIVISNAITKQYTTYLYYLGKCNTVASIIQSHCQATSAYATTSSNKLYIYGESQTKTNVELGSIIFFGYNELQKLTINEYDNDKHLSNPDNCNYLLYETSTKESATKYYILNCTINAEDKRIYDGYGSGTMTNSTVRIGGEKHYSGFSIAGTSYVRIYGDLIGIRSPLSLGGSSSLIVDGGIYTRRSSSYSSAYYGTTTVSTSGCLIVKGNILDTVALSKSGNGVIIANTIAVSKNYTISNGQIITNLFTNSVTAYPTLDSNGDYTYPLITESLIKNTYKIADNARTDLNEDSYPYLNIAHYYGITATYLMSGGSVYLLGDYDTSKNAYDNQRKLLDGTTYSKDNAVADVLKASGLIDENGDLLSSYYGIALSTTLLNTVSSAAKNAYDAQVAEYGEDIFKHECVQIGNTRFDGSSSSPCKTLVSQTGGTLYAAGNLTYFNDTTVSDGTIYCAGSLGSKRDVTISGGTIHAKEIGNACTLLVNKNDVMLRYGKTVLAGGTIYTDRLGQLSHDTNGNTSRSTLFVTGTVTLNSYGESGTIDIYDDLYVNYVCENGYSVDAASADYLVYKGSIAAGKISSMPDLTADTQYDLSAPVGTPAAVWCFNTSGGTQTENVAAEGSINGAGSEYVFNGYESADFYSAKEGYTLILREGDYLEASYIGKNKTKQYFEFTDAPSTSDYKGYKIATVPFGSSVTVKISDSTMYEKNVVWYTDASGTLRNAMSSCDADGTLTFTMPAADTEIYITDDLDLYLDKYEISLIDDGFAVEAPSSTRREDASFFYKGNLNIRQSTSAVTYNSVYWESGSGNLLDDGTTDRTVTYCSLNQKMSGSKVGTDIAKSTKVQINISGNVKIAPVNLPGKQSASATTDSTLVLQGSDRSKDSLAFYTMQAFDNYRAIGYSTDSTCGNVTFSDLKLSTTTGTYFTKCNNSSYKYCDTKFINCDLKTVWSSSYVLVSNANNLYIDNCNFNLYYNSPSYTSYVSSSNHVYINKGTKFDYTYGGTYSGYPFWTYMGTLEINDSEVTSCYNTHASSLYINTEVKTGTITLNNGTLNTAGETRLVSLTMNGASQVNVGTDKKGYLMCESVSVNGTSELNAGYVVIAGHSNTMYTDENTFDTAAKAGTAFVNGSSKTGFVMTGGTANISEFVGGDYNGKVTIKGGTLNAKQIGTCGMLFGYKQLIPNTGKTDFAYTYEKTPVGATVNVEGGTVNVLEDGVLGGINSKVNVSGGTINLADNAFIGISTEEQEEVEFDALVAGTEVSNPSLVTLVDCAVNSNGTTGSINAPYSTLNISGSSTAINVDSITADGGAIVISDAASGAGSNPYTGQEKRKPANVGAIAKNISADTITIKDNASVYAEMITANGDGSGAACLIVESGFLSTAGGFAEAKHADANRYDATANGDNQTVFGLKMVAITYVLDPEGTLLSGDESNVINDNITSYAVTSNARTIEIKDAECAGYYFKGWYVDEELTNPAGDSFNTSFANDITLYAKWERVKVKIAVVIDSDSTSYDLTEEFEGTSWEKNADGSYTSGNYAYVTYGDKIISSSGVSYSNYNTLKYGVTQFNYFKEQSGKTVTGSTAISQATVMSSEIAEIYKSISDNGKDSSAVIRLHVTSMQNLYATLRFVLNKQNGKPVDAAFDTTSSTSIEYSVSIDATLKTVTAFAGSGTERSSDLVTASATGYTFLGWNTDKDATEKTTTGWLTGDSYIEETTVAYAIWQANTYRIRFTTSDGQWITAHNDRPVYGSEHVTSLDYYWIYDTPVTQENCFWLVTADDDPLTELPYAWKEGYKFEQQGGWSYSYTDGTGKTRTEKISSTSALSKLVIQSINTTAFDSGTQRPETPGLILTASYTKASVTYDLNGGKWTGASGNSEKLAYGNALRGMSQTSSPDTGNELIGASVTEENTLDYNVQSTTADTFAKNGAYTAEDYRNQLSRKGYTFCGWYTSEDAAADPQNAASDAYKVGSSPRFEDIKVYAGWSANTYDLDLYSYDKADHDYVAYNVKKENHIPDVTVTVGESIASSKWPSRTGDWYAYNKGDDTSDDNKKRFLLGFTFTGLDPGNSSSDSAGYSNYQAYAQAITNLENCNAMFMNEEKDTDGKLLVEGSVFNLPEDDVYTTAVNASETITIPDYPRGSTIPMYATYRERSLVFKERYIDPDGNVQQKVKFSCAWNQWSEYADNYGDGNEEILSQGYSLIGWYINGTTSAATKYPMAKDYLWGRVSAAAIYMLNMNTYKQNAEDLGTYDIIVYTVYVAQVEKNVTLTASSDPTSTDDISNSYVLPASMQKGILSLKTTAGTDLNLVSKTEMDTHGYDSEWTSGGKTYTADNTVAVTATISNDGTSYSYDLTDGTKSTGKTVSSGWTITLQLYHSKVMTEEAKDMTMTVELLFDDKTSSHSNTLTNQFVKENVTIDMTASLYKVQCIVDLPEQLKDLTLTASGDYTGSYQQTATSITEEFTRAYGSDINVNKPAFTGYDANDGWTYSDNVAYTDLTMKVSAANKGVVQVHTAYTPHTHKLTVSSDVLDGWTALYGDGAGKTASSSYLSVVNVKYGSEVRITKKTADSVPQFVLVNGDKMDEMAETSDEQTWIFRFPDEDVNVTFNDVQTMYLDEGTINITESGYTYKGVTKTWPGNYVILQNKDDDAGHSTANVLTLAGDLADRSIELGNLNISSADSISLSGATAKVTANGNITAKNILVPYDSSLTLTGSTDVALTLTPASGKAGIGGDKVNTQSGEIKLDSFDVNVTLIAGSSASGIGSGTQDAAKASKEVTLNNCTVKMKETAGTSAYTGSWIGGYGVSKVTLTDTTVERLDDSTNHTAGPCTISGKTVSLTDSKIGTDAADSVYNPIYAEEELQIEDSCIYLTIQDNLNNNTLAKSPIGTASDGVIKTNSTIQVTKAGLGDFDKLYTGLLNIESAKADIVISDQQILESSLGSIEIKDDGVRQEGTTLAHTGSYMIIQEGKADANNPSDITVSSMAAGKTLAFIQPTAKSDNSHAVGNTAVVLGTVDIQTSMTVENEADLDIKNGFTISGDLIVNSDDHTVKLEKDSLDCEGSYTQNGGELESNKNIGGKSLDLTLNDVTTTAKNLIGADMLINGGSVTASQKVGSESGTVEFKDAAVVKATSIGAIGAEGSTFTFVEISDDVIFKGTVYRDLYRISYDTSGLTLNTSSLPTVYRDYEKCNDEAFDKTKANSNASIPGNPTGRDIDLFTTWFMFDRDGSTRLALQADGYERPYGIDGVIRLDCDSIDEAYSKDVTANADKTKTLTIHAWAKTTATAVIVSGRKFIDFTSTAKSVTIENNKAFTMKLTSTGSIIEGRDYYVNFSSKLPVGTEMTLVKVKADGSYDYYYKVLSAKTDTVRFSEFIKNGTESTVLSLATGTGEEEFLLGVDFSEASTLPTNAITMTYGIIPDGTNRQDLVSGVKCSFNAVKEATIAYDSHNIFVTQAPSGDSDLSDQKVFIKAVVKDADGKEVTLGLDTTAKLGDAEAVFVKRSTLVFEIGTYATINTSYTEALSIDGLPAGTYTIDLTMVSGEGARDNVFRNVLSNTIHMTYEVEQEKIHGLTELPWLQASSSKSGNTIRHGSAENIAITYLTSADKVSISVKKLAKSGEFEDVTGGTVTYNTSTETYQGTENIAFASSAKYGVYLIELSMNSGTDNDNVYFLYTVK